MNEVRNNSVERVVEAKHEHRECGSVYLLVDGRLMTAPLSTDGTWMIEELEEAYVTYVTVNGSDCFTQADMDRITTALRLVEAPKL